MATRTLSAAYNAGEAGIKAAIESKAASSALSAKANTADVEEALALKADATAVTGALALKADTDHTHAFAALTSKPTTLDGYGITDTIKAQVISQAAYDLLDPPDSSTLYVITS